MTLYKSDINYFHMSSLEQLYEKACSDCVLRSSIKCCSRSDFGEVLPLDFMG